MYSVRVIDKTQGGRVCIAHNVTYVGIVIMVTCGQSKNYSHLGGAGETKQIHLSCKHNSGFECMIICPEI